MLQLLIYTSALIHIALGSVLPVLTQQNGRNVSLTLYNSLEELARIVDISYCVGTTGIQQPFSCLSRCKEFKGFELITTWNTGPLFSDSCGYIALSHEPYEKRVIVAFRGTYSIANTIADLSTNPAQYAPFPDDNDDNAMCMKELEPAAKEPLIPQLLKQTPKRSLDERCANCTVHSGFMTSWRNTRCTIIPHVEKALQDHPDYKLTLVGHSLGGAVAALAALEFQARGWNPQVTTFGEPRIGNEHLSKFIDMRFNLGIGDPEEALYRRVTHVSDPVPLLPLEQWGYKMHAGEIYISSSSLPPNLADLRHCVGDQDRQCIQHDGWTGTDIRDTDLQEYEDMRHDGYGIEIPPHYKLWHLFFAHRDYFWRLGLCLPGGDPWNWWRETEINGTSDEI